MPINEANGKILSYNVSCSSEEETQSLSEIPDPQHKAEMQLGRHDYIISVVARNSVGSSPPSRIASMELPHGECLRPLVRGVKAGGVMCSSDLLSFLCALLQTRVGWDKEPNVQYSTHWGY